MKSNATIYIADPSLIGSKLFDQFSEIKKVKPLSENRNATGLAMDLGYARIQMNFIPQEDVTEHLAGLKGYINHTFKGDEDELVYILARLHAVSFIIGMIINPIFEEEPKTIDFLYNLNNRLNGLLFLYDNLIDYDGSPLIGSLTNEN